MSAKACLSALSAGVVAAMVLFTGCANQSAGPTAPAAAAAAEKTVTAKKDAEKASATGPEFVYQYNPVGKRDPFRSAVDSGDLAASNSRTLCQEPLCQWDLDQLTLVAVVTGDANPIAMVEDPAGRGHIVRRNTRMGKQDGRVSQILRDSVIVTEYWLAPDGKTKPNPVAMKLKEDVASLPPFDMLTGQPYQ